MQASRPISVSPHIVPNTVYTVDSPMNRSVRASMAREVEHGLMQARLSMNHMQHQAVSQENHSIDQRKGTGLG